MLFKDDLIYSLLKQENSMEKIIDYKFLLEKVESIIDTLPPRRKEIFVKRNYECLSIRQIAEELNISPNTVENQLASARKQILDKFKDEKLAVMIFLMLFTSL